MAETVFLVWVADEPHEPTWVEGVFSSRDKAEAFMEVVGESFIYADIQEFEVSE